MASSNSGMSEVDSIFPAQRKLQPVGIMNIFFLPYKTTNLQNCSNSGLGARITGHSVAEESWRLGSVSTSSLSSTVYLQYGVLSGFNAKDVFHFDLRFSLSEFIRTTTACAKC